MRSPISSIRHARSPGGRSVYPAWFSSTIFFTHRASRWGPAVCSRRGGSGEHARAFPGPQPKNVVLHPTRRLARGHLESECAQNGSPSAELNHGSQDIEETEDLTVGQRFVVWVSLVNHAQLPAKDGQGQAWAGASWIQQAGEGGTVQVKIKDAEE